MAKLKCSKCQEITKLSKEEQELLDLGVINPTAYICDDCAVEE
jgi:hypothetical protein